MLEPPGFPSHHHPPQPLRLSMLERRILALLEYGVITFRVRRLWPCVVVSWT